MWLTATYLGCLYYQWQILPVLIHLAMALLTDRLYSARLQAGRVQQGGLGRRWCSMIVDLCLG
jgi:hypothetical protein